MYALVDCNNFYVSCERVFRPDLEGKPVVVLSNNDGCIISRSDEAKALGIGMAAPEFKLREELKAKGVVVFSSNYALYGDLSSRVMNILRQFTPHIEEYSIDEAFIQFKGKMPDYGREGQEIRNRIGQWIGIPVCIGFGPTKALSKIANKIARKFPEKTKGVYVIDTEEKRLKALKWTVIEAVWGIGYRMAKKLRSRGIGTALDFIDPKHESWIKGNWGVDGIRLRMELMGQSALPLLEPVLKKNIMVTRSFPKKLADFDSIRERVSTFASVCGEKLRAQHCCCLSVTVLLGVSEEEGRSRRHYHETILLPFATHSTLVLVETAVRLLSQLYEKQGGQRFNRAGVMVSQLIREEQKQFAIFEEEDPRHLAIMNAMDKVNKRLGDRIVRLGVQDKKTWNMKQERLSPRYTTRFDEILRVRC